MNSGIVEPIVVSQLTIEHSDRLNVFFLGHRLRSGGVHLTVTHRAAFLNDCLQVVKEQVVGIHRHRYRFQLGNRRHLHRGRGARRDRLARGNIPAAVQGQVLESIAPIASHQLAGFHRQHEDLDTRRRIHLEYLDRSNGWVLLNIGHRVELHWLIHEWTLQRDVRTFNQAESILGIYGSVREISPAHKHPGSRLNIGRVSGIDSDDLGRVNQRHRGDGIITHVSLDVLVMMMATMVRHASVPKLEIFCEWIVYRDWTTTHVDLFQPGHLARGGNVWVSPRNVEHHLSKGSIPTLISRLPAKHQSALGAVDESGNGGHVSRALSKQRWKP